MGLFSNAKDRLVERVALSYLNTSLLAPYGRAASLAIDSAARSILIKVELNGEVSPVEVAVTDYEITEEAGRYFAVLKAIHTSREWLTALARDQLCGRRLELGPQAGRWLMRLM